MVVLIAVEKKYNLILINILKSSSINGREFHNLVLTTGENVEI